MVKMIIHAEDDPSQRELLRAFLSEELGFMIISCSDGQEAAEKLQHEARRADDDVGRGLIDGFICRRVGQGLAERRCRRTVDR